MVVSLHYLRVILRNYIRKSRKITYYKYFDSKKRNLVIMYLIAIEVVFNIFRARTVL